MKVGLDIGYSSVKLAYGTDRLPEMVRMPIGAAPEHKCCVTADGSVSVGAGHRVLIKSEPWVAGIDPMRLSGFVPVMDASYPSTDEYRSMFYASLCEVGSERIDMLVTGLPVSHYRRGTVRDDLARMMQGRHEVREGLIVEVKKVVVIPHPVGAYGAYSLDVAMSRGVRAVEPGSSILVVDPGHYSLDWVVFHNGFKPDSSGSTSTAGEVVIRKAAEALSSLHGVKIRPEKLQGAVLSGAKPLVIAGKSIDFWPAIEEAAVGIVNGNLRALQGAVRSVSDTHGIDMVLMTGGGAGLFEEALKRAFAESEVISMNDPIMANARGFFAFADSAAKAASSKE